MIAGPRRRLKYLVAINSRSLPEQTPSEFAIRYLDIGAVGRGALAAEPEVTTFGEAPSRARRLVVEGDTIVSTVRTYLRAVWPVRGDTDGLVVSTGFVVLSPGPMLESRYLGWVAQSDVVIEEVVARSVGVSYPGINGLEIGDIRIPVPPLREQRSIADYLDAETARIDHVAGLVGRRAEALAEHLAVSTEELIGDERWNREPLKRVARYREGPGVLSGDIRDSGVPLLRIVNLVNDTVVLEDLRYLDADMVRSRWPHMRVHAGELIVSGSATSGLPVVVPDEAEGAVPWTGLIRMWPSTARLDRDYLRMFLGSSLFLDQVNLLRTGIGLQHWGPSHLAQVWIPMPPVDHQRAIARTLSLAREVVRRARASSEAEVERLLERRRALITAAVSGQLEIPAVAA